MAEVGVSADGDAEGDFRGFRFEGEGLAVDQGKRGGLDDVGGNVAVVARGHGGMAFHAD